MRRFASDLERGRQVKISKFLYGLRRSDRAKQVDMDFFSNLSVGEGKADDEVLSQVTSVPSTLASGSMTNPRPRGSSPSKTMVEDMALLKGQMASMQGAIARLLELPALQASIPKGRKVSPRPGSSTRDQSRSPSRQLRISGQTR